MSTVKLDKELERYRSLMEVPSTFEDGFSWTALVGAIFVALIMVPGAMYMGLLAGQGIGPAAQWVTVILFIEVARRAHKSLRRPEIFVLFYMAGAAMGQPFSGLLWNQFFVHSQAATGMGIAEEMATFSWYAPTDPNILAQRNFFTWAWMPAIALIIFQTVTSRLNTMILSYGLFRLASDIEKLPFPMAPIGAAGIMALAEQQSEESAKGANQPESWRWRIFSIGGVLGLAFGAVYLALPAISTALFKEPIIILPIPFLDWTKKTSDFIPAVATGLSLDLGQVILGMVLPFYAMVGSFVGLVMMMIANPLMYLHSIGGHRVLRSWTNGDDTITTLFKNNMDFYFSFGLGLAIAIALMGVWQVYRGVQGRKKQAREEALWRKNNAAASAATPAARTGPPPGRGDIKARFIIGTYILTSVAYVLLSGWLIDWHPTVMIVLVFFAFLYVPILAYVTVRLEGMAGQVVQIPMVREAAFILSGYQGVKIWFLPLPLADYSGQTVFYRQAELTGTRFWSIWKAELMLMPIVMISSIVFSQFIWSLGDIPGPQYPFAEAMWELNAANSCIMFSSTLGRHSAFMDAINGWYIGAGTGVGLVLFIILSVVGAPIMLMYGLVRGLNQTLPHVVVPQFIGALLGRFYFERKIGLNWRQYVPVVFAGFSCGMGLITVFGVGINFLAKAVINILF